LNTDLQAAAESALREGLINYERAAGRYIWRGPRANILSKVQKEMSAFAESESLGKLEKAKSQESLFNSIVGTKKSNEPEVSPSHLVPWLNSIEYARRVFPTPVR